MNTLKRFATRHPAIFGFSLTIAWFVGLLLIAGTAASALHKPFGDPVSSTLARLASATGVLWLGWRLGWLKASGITRLGRWPIWLLALGGMTCLALASLYSYFGQINFDFSSLAQLPEARAIVVEQLAVSLGEELLFRGVVLYSLIRVWGNTKRGMIGSVVLTAVIFALLHLTNIFAYGMPLSAALLVTLQTCIVAIWWGGLVLLGKSIWPAVLLHLVGNAVLPVQSLTVDMAVPELTAIVRLLLFSIPLGVLGILLLAKAAPRPIVPEVP